MGRKRHFVTGAFSWLGNSYQEFQNCAHLAKRRQGPGGETNIHVPSNPGNPAIEDKMGSFLSDMALVGQLKI